MKHIFPFDSKISGTQRSLAMHQQPHLVWLTGLSGSGKTSLAQRLEHCLFHQGYKVFLLDGDNVRHGLNRDLSFSEHDRRENVRRVAEVGNLMLEAGLVVICAFISPYRHERELVKQVARQERFTEVFVNCPLQVCEKRDTKGLYAKAKQGLIQNFTGISAPYEQPLHPHLELHTDTETVEESLKKLLAHVLPKIEMQEQMKVAANG